MKGRVRPERRVHSPAFGVEEVDTCGLGTCLFSGRTFQPRFNLSQVIVRAPMISAPPGGKGSRVAASWGTGLQSSEKSGDSELAAPLKCGETKTGVGRGGRLARNCWETRRGRCGEPRKTEAPVEPEPYRELGGFLPVLRFCLN